MRQDLKSSDTLSVPESLGSEDGGSKVFDFCLSICLLTSKFIMFKKTLVKLENQTLNLELLIFTCNSHQMVDTQQVFVWF